MPIQPSGYTSIYSGHSTTRLRKPCGHFEPQYLCKFWTPWNMLKLMTTTTNTEKPPKKSVMLRRSPAAQSHCHCLLITLHPRRKRRTIISVWFLIYIYWHNSLNPRPRYSWQLVAWSFTRAQTLRRRLAWNTVWCTLHTIRRHSSVWLLIRMKWFRSKPIALALEGTEQQIWYIGKGRGRKEILTEHNFACCIVLAITMWASKNRRLFKICWLVFNCRWFSQIIIPHISKFVSV